MNRLIYSIIFVLLLFYGCKNGQQQTPVATDTPVSSNSSKADTTRPQAAVEQYPLDSIASQVRILNESVYHNDEVDTAIIAGNWLGLFKGKTYYIAPTRVTIEQIKDEVVDDGNEKTGWEINDDNKDSTVLLIKNEPGLKQGNVLATPLPPAFGNHIRPGKPFRFIYGSKEYVLSAKADERNGSELWNYQLFVTAEKNGQRITQLLVSQPSLDDAIPSILFCGDLDGDGIPDLIINSTYHYNLYQPTLYLSGTAEDGKLYRLVAIHHAVGC